MGISQECNVKTYGLKIEFDQDNNKNNNNNHNNAKNKLFDVNYKPKPVVNIKAGNLEWGEKTFRSQKDITCSNGQKVKISYANDIEYDMELYFDSDMYTKKDYPAKMPTEGVPRVLYSAESYLMSNCLLEEGCSKYFNWTYAVAEDADIQFMYYTKKKVIDNFLSQVHSFKFDAHVMERKRAFKKEYVDKGDADIYPLASWMTMNCGGRRTSNRLEYVQEMMRLMPVHSVGKCLNNIVLEENKEGRKGDGGYENKRGIISKYKFYFAFENSMCRGYFSEKPIHCYEAGTVPIVMMHPDTLQYLPRGSYIYVGDFDSAQELVDYLRYLDQNDDEYKKYFKWRTNKHIISEWMEKIKDVEQEECELARLYNQWRSGNYFNVKQLHQYKESECKSPDYHPIFNK
eukprot:gene2904-3615_t